MRRSVTGALSHAGLASNDGMARASGAWFQKETAPQDAFLLTGDDNLIDFRSAIQYRVKIGIGL